MSILRSAAVSRTRRVAVSAVLVGGLVVGAGGTTFALTQGHGHAAAHPAATVRHAAPAAGAAHAAPRADVGAVRTLLAGSYVARPHHQSQPDPTLKCRQDPTVSGKSVVGSRLRATTGKWKRSKHAVFRFSYQWLANGKPIKHATKPTFVTPKSTVGTYVSVKVTAKDAKKKYDSAFAVSKGVKIVLPQLRSSGKPRVIGGAHPSVGKTLTAGPSHWSVKHPKLTYVWIDVDRGRAIKGATRATYQPSRKQVGDRLVVQVTASRPGYRDAVVSSQMTERVAR